MMVISSIIESLFFQSLTLSWTTFSHPFLALWDFIYFINIFITFLLDKNSQTPSEARISALSISVTQKCFISGLCMTPAQTATSSPNDLLIANPGIWRFFSQTLEGPISLFLASLNHATLPPLFFNPVLFFWQVWLMIPWESFSTPVFFLSSFINSLYYYWSWISHIRSSNNIIWA